MMVGSSKVIHWKSAEKKLKWAVFMLWGTNWLKLPKLNFGSTF